MKREKAEEMVRELVNAVVTVARTPLGPGNVSRMNLVIDRLIMTLERCPDAEKKVEQ